MSLNDSNAGLLMEVSRDEEASSDENVRVNQLARFRLAVEVPLVAMVRYNGYVFYVSTIVENDGRIVAVSVEVAAPFSLQLFCRHYHIRCVRSVAII